MDTNVVLLEMVDPGPEPEIHLIGPLLLDLACSRTAGRLRVTEGSRVVATAEAPADDIGTTVQIPLLTLPPQCELALQLSIARGGGGDWSPVASFAVERTGLLPRSAAELSDPRPLLVTSVGRSGSTLLMQLLDGHPDIAIHNDYPYETTEARKRFQEALASYPRICRGQWESKFRKPGWEKLMLTTVTSLIRRSADAAGRWYTDMHRERTGLPTTPKYYAEKNLGPAWLVREARPDAREIFLVRDPRDLICSTLAFNEKRGEIGFGRQDVASDLEFVSHRAAMARPWVVEPWRRRHDDALLVRYEDLVQDTRSELARIFSYLEIEAGTPTVGAAVRTVAEAFEVREKHMTATSAQASIGRWRRDLPEELAAACRREFADFFELFEYPSE